MDQAIDLPAETGGQPRSTPGGGGLRRWLNVLLALTAVAAFAATIVPTLSVNRTWSYPAAEWLFNYGGGFIRRGLGGWLISATPGLSERVALIALVSGLFVVVVVWFALLISAVMSATSGWVPLLLWFLPGGPLLGVTQLWWQPYSAAAAVFVFRKEYLAYAVVLIVALILIHGRSRAADHLVLVGVCAGTATLAVSLIHEGAAAFAAASVVMVLWAVETPIRRRVAASLAVMVPTVIGIVVALVHSTAGPGTAQAMWLNLEPQTRAWLGGAMPNAFLFSEWGARQVRDLTYQQVVASGYWPFWLLLAVLSIMITWLILRAIDRRMLRPQALAFAVLCAGALALSVMAGDVGRWISMVCMLAAIVTLAWICLRPPEVPTEPSRRRIVATVTLVLVGIIAGLPVAGDPRGLPWTVGTTTALVPSDADLGGST